MCGVCTRDALAEVCVCCVRVQIDDGQVANALFDCGGRCVCVVEFCSLFVRNSVLGVRILNGIV